jgi:hypothetical protein
VFLESGTVSRQAALLEQQGVVAELEGAVLELELLGFPASAPVLEPDSDLARLQPKLESN